MQETSGIIPVGMRTGEASYKPSFQGAAKAVKRERSFELSLPALVSGEDVGGRSFEEETRILSISSQNALFWLKAKVLIGTPLRLSLDIPKTIILENRLNLILTGKVMMIQASIPSKNGQLVSVELDKSYKIRSSER